MIKILRTPCQKGSFSQLKYNIMLWASVNHFIDVNELNNILSCP